MSVGGYVHTQDVSCECTWVCVQRLHVSMMCVWAALCAYTCTGESACMSCVSICSSLCVGGYLGTHTCVVMVMCMYVSEGVNTCVCKWCGCVQAI